MEKKEEYKHTWYIANQARILADRKEKYFENRDSISSQSKRHREDLRLLILRHYSNGTYTCSGWDGNGCSSHCDDIRALSLDHINAGGRQERLKFNNHYRLYAWLIKNNYPSGYQVLCMNCQWIKRRENHENGGRHRWLDIKNTKI